MSRDTAGGTNLLSSGQYYLEGEVVWLYYEEKWSLSFGKSQSPDCIRRTSLGQWPGGCITDCDPACSAVSPGKQVAGCCYTHWTPSNQDPWSEATPATFHNANSESTLLIRALWLVPRLARLEGVHCIEGGIVYNLEDMIFGTQNYYLVYTGGLII